MLNFDSRQIIPEGLQVVNYFERISLIQSLLDRTYRNAAEIAMVAEIAMALGEIKSRKKGDQTKK